MKGTVVIISIVHWHFTWQSQHNMAAGLAERGYQVLFVEPMPKRWPRINEFSRVWGRLTGNSVAAGLCRQPLIPGVDLVSPRLLPDTGTLTRSLNRRLFVPGLVSKLQQEVRRPLIVINYLPTSASLALMEGLRPDATFYHCVNDWGNDPYAPAVAIESELVDAVDMIWADSPVNFARTSKMSENVVQLSSGVNIDLFTKARKAPQPPPARPFCAYFGTIGISADLDLLRKVSHHYPLRLIGPVRVSLEGFAKDTQIVGPVAHEKVPELLRDVDTLLLPYVHSAHNDSVMPAKLFECLATGKPIVACGLKTLYDYPGLFYIRETHETFLDTVAESVHEPPEFREARIACAEQNSFSQLITTIEEYFQQMLRINTPDKAHAAG